MTTKCHWIFLKLVNILLILWISGNINFDSLIIDNRNIIFSTFIVDNRKIVSTKAQHCLVYDVGNSGHLVAAFPRKEVQFVESTLRWNYEDH